MSKHFKNIGLVSALTMASRLMGLVRESLTAAVFGASGVVSAYLTGFMVPNLFRRLLAEGGLTAALVPTLNDELAARKREGAFALVNQVASWLFLLTGLLVLLAMFLLSQEGLVRHVAGIFHPDQATLQRWILTAHFTVALFPYLLFISLAAAFSGALQTLHRFAEPALSPVSLNLAMISALAIAWHFSRNDESRAAQWLCAGVLVGGFLQMSVQAAALMNEGWRPALDFRFSEPLRTMLRLMGPTVFSSSIYLINMSVSRFIGLSLNDEAVAVLNYSQRLMELPIGVFAVAVSTVVFPLISRFAAAGDAANVTRAYRKGMRLILVVTLPSAAGLAVLAMPTIRLIFQHGAFHHQTTAVMTPVLVANALGLPFVAFTNLALRGFYALKDTATPMRAALFSFVLNVILSLVLMGPLSTLGLAIASNIAVAIQAVYLQWHLSRLRDDFAFRHLIRDVAKVAAASGSMAILVAVGWRGWEHLVPAGRWAEAAGLAAAVVGGAGIYAIMVWFLKIEGREEIAALLSRVRARAARSDS